MTGSTTAPTSRSGFRLPDPVRREVVRQTLSTMCETERLALALYYYEKLGPASVAEALDLSRLEAVRLLVDSADRVARALEREEGRSHETDRRPAR